MSLLDSLAFRCRVRREQEISGEWTLGGDASQAGFILICGGVCRLQSPPHKAVRVMPGDVVLWRPGLACTLASLPADHVEHSSPETTWPPLDDPFGSVKLITGTIEFPASLRHPLAGLVERVLHVEAARPASGLVPQLGECLAIACRNELSTDLVRDRLAQVLVLEALLAGCGSATSLSSGWARVAMDAELGGIFDQMVREPEREWTVASLAEAAAMSRATLTRRFQERAGCSPMDCLLELRMRRACELLSQHQAELKLVARTVGYRSASAFAAAFKRWSGRPPSVYRAEAGHS